MSGTWKPPVPFKPPGLRGTLRTSSKIASPQLYADEEFVRSLFKKNGLIIRPKVESRLFESCADLQSGSLSTKEFADLVKPWLTFGGVSTFDPYIDVFSATQDAAQKIKARAEGKKLSVRYLSALETARVLAPESVKVVTVVKEVVEAAFDDHEVTFLFADLLVIRGFLQEEIVPFLRQLETFPSEKVPLELIRQKRKEVKEKLGIQQKNVNVHLQRAEIGVTLMHQDTYYIKTNHIPRYAAASALEVLLRAYYVLLGGLDPEDIMIESDWDNLRKAAQERSQNIYTIYQRYAQERVTLLSKKYNKESSHTHSFLISDGGSKNDHIFQKFDIHGHASQFVRYNAHEKGAATTHDDGTLEYYNDSFRGRDWSTGPGLEIYKEILPKFVNELAANGPVWQNVFQPHIRNMEFVLERLHIKTDNGAIGGLSQPLLQITQAEAPRTETEPRTMPLDLWLEQPNLVDPVKGWYFMDGEQMFEDRKHILLAVLCTGWGIVTPASYDLGATQGWAVINGKPKYTSKHMLKVVSEDEDHYTWIGTTGSNVPSSAVPLGQNADSQPLYMARAYYNFEQISGLAIGVVGPGTNGFQTALAGSLLEGVTYEVLCYKQ